MTDVTTGAETHTGTPAPVTSGVLIIESMPAKLRPRVEQLMVDTLRSESTWVVPGDDPLHAQWCTRWYKDWPGMNLADIATLAAETSHVPAGIGCRQVITATVSELEALARGIGKMAQDYAFSARLTM